MKTQTNQRLSSAIAVLLSIGSLFVLNGCDSSSHAQFHQNPTAQREGLASDPSTVCQLLLDAVARGDREFVVKHLATNRIAADVQSITKGKKGFEKFQSNAAALAAASFFSSIESLEKDSRKVIRQEIADQEASVTVAGVNRESKELTKEIRFVREDGAWKLVPSRT